MVEKNVAYNRSARSEGFDDNDPLAELTRLVGQDDRTPRPAAFAPSFAARPAPLMERREPEFNLEDELLREFEVYDGPRPDLAPMTDPAPMAEMPSPPPVPAGQFMQRVEALFEPVAAQPMRPVAADLPVLPPVAERQGEFSPRFEAGRDDEPAFDSPGDVPHYAVQGVPDAFAAAARDSGAEQAASGPDDLYGRTETAAAPAPLLSADLADALEDAVAAAAPSPSALPAQGAGQNAGRRSSLEFSGLRLPLANFGAPRVPNPSPEARAPVVPQPVPMPEPAAIEPEPVIFPTPVVAPVPLAAPAFAESAPPEAEAVPSMDALIRDVARYPIGQSARPATGRAEPAGGNVLAEGSSRERVFSERAAGERPLDAVAARAAARARALPAAPLPPRIAPVSPPPQSVAVAPAATAADELDVFNDPDFELALDDIDIDLDIDIDFSDIGDIDAKFADAPSFRPQPVARHEAVRHEAAGRDVAGRGRADGAARAVAVAPVPENLPFDPFQIGETGDQPEALAEMDVPELPAAMLEQKPAPRRPEEDLDLDTELATLFAPAAGGLDRQKGAGARPAAPTRQEVDEFERALEQDFRRSMQEAAENRADVPRYAPTPVQQARLYDYAEPRPPRRWLLPAAAALGLVLIGGGVYALFFGGPAGQGAGGAPVIISADNGPMKVAPENPGGRVVPNQNQAVYKSVAGNAPADPKQPALISTNEQPVDVVQRTLVPEQLPLEDEDDSGVDMAGTPVGETQDPRLLSPREQKQAAANGGGSPVDVSPRKVRTMIVKPDGTLVAQETEAPSAAPPAARVATAAAPPPVEASQMPSSAQAAMPVPALRPTSQQPANAVAAVADPGNARTAAVQTAPATPAVTGSIAPAAEYYIQIASLPSETEAQKSYQSLSAKFGSVIGGRGVDIKAAEIAGKGTFYRVRIPAGDKNEAAVLCERLRAAGGTCLIAR